MKNAKKITSILVIATITMGMFVGCGSKSTADASTTQNTGARTNNYSAEMKTTYSTVLKSLVTDKTITQVQSGKVLALVSKAIPTGGGRPSGGGKSDGQKPSGTPPTDDQNSGGTTQKGDNKQSGTRKAGGMNSRSNQLASLVTSKVITQVQATAINTKVQATMKSMQGTKTN